MDIRDWQLLLALEEEKSMGKAGERLFLSQPAVVYRLNRMEQEFGTILFIRNNRGIQFTGAGQRLFLHASDMLKKYNSITHEIQQYGTGVSGNITVGSSSTFLGNFLPGQLKAFYKMYPLVTVSLVAKRNDMLVEMLNGGQLSVAVIRGHHNWSGKTYHLYDDPLVLICSEPCSIESLKAIPYIPYSGDPEIVEMIVDWGREQFGVPLVTTTDATRVSGPQICVQLVKAGLGWSVVPLSRTLGIDGLYKMPLTQSDRVLTRPTNLFYNADTEQIDAYSAYIKHFKEYFKDFSFPSFS